MRFRGILLVTIALMALLALVGTASAETYDGELVTTGKIHPGDEFTIKIYINDADGGNYTIELNQNLVEYFNFVTPSNGTWNGDLAAAEDTGRPFLLNVDEAAADTVYGDHNIQYAIKRGNNTVKSDQIVVKVSKIPKDDGDDDAPGFDAVLLTIALPAAIAVGIYRRR